MNICASIPIFFFIDEGIESWLGQMTFPGFPGDIVRKEKDMFLHPGQCSWHSPFIMII